MRALILSLMIFGTSHSGFSQQGIIKAGNAVIRETTALIRSGGEAASFAKNAEVYKAITEFSTAKDAQFYLEQKVGDASSTEAEVGKYANISKEAREAIVAANGSLDAVDSRYVKEVNKFVANVLARELALTEEGVQALKATGSKNQTFNSDELGLEKSSYSSKSATSTEEALRVSGNEINSEVRAMKQNSKIDHDTFLKLTRNLHKVEGRIGSIKDIELQKANVRLLKANFNHKKLILKYNPSMFDSGLDCVKFVDGDTTAIVRVTKYFQHMNQQISAAKALTLSSYGKHSKGAFVEATGSKDACPSLKSLTANNCLTKPAANACI